MQKLCFVTAVLLCLTVAAPAAAAPPALASSMDNHLSVWGILGFTGYFSTGFGAGVRYQKTLVPEGFLKNATIKDDLGLEAGADFVRYSWNAGYLSSNYSWSVNEITPVVGALWNIWLNPQLAVYPKIDLGYHIATVSTPSAYGGPSASYGGVAFQGAVGVVYKLDKLTLRAEAGSYTLRAGAGFTF
jgi:hypothetical protein